MGRTRVIFGNIWYLLSEHSIEIQMYYSGSDDIMLEDAKERVQERVQRREAKQHPVAPLALSQFASLLRTES